MVAQCGLEIAKKHFINSEMFSKIKPMRILLLGKKGLLGTEFLKILEGGEYDFLAPSHSKLDVSDVEAIEGFTKENGKFDRVIFCVGYTAVDHAEIDRDACKKANVDCTKNLLKFNSPIIHFSTDYIFDAPLGIEIDENYRRSPLNFYGETKLRAEIFLENSGVDFWNIRTSGLFGKGKNNFFITMYDLSQKFPELKIVDDQILRPTLTSDLAKYVMQNFVKKIQPCGHYHAQNSGNSASWADLARFYLDLKSINTPIKKITSKEFDAPAKRPKNSVLKNTKLNENLRDWQEAMREYVG